MTHGISLHAMAVSTATASAPMTNRVSSKYKVGDRVGVFVDLDGGEGGDGGSVRFFVNGSEYGPGFKSGVVGPVVLGVELFFKNQKVTLLPDAERPAGA